MALLDGGLPKGTPSLGEMPSYVQTNIRSFLTQNDTMMRTSEAVQGTPCAACDALLTARIGWPYYQLVRHAAGETWPERLTSVPRAEWRHAPQRTPH